MQPTILILTLAVLGFLIWRFIIIGIGLNDKIARVLISNSLNLFYSRRSVFQAWDHFQPPSYFGGNGWKMPLLDFFLDEVFKKEYVDYSRFLILGPSGIGKTVSLIRLFAAWKLKLGLKPFEVELVSLSGLNHLGYIANIPDKENTILLLDGLDSQVQNHKEYRERLDILLEATKSFSKVIITCQSGFLPESVEGEAGDEMIKYTGENNYQIFRRVEIMPWSMQSSLHYASQKLGALDRRRRVRAHNWILSHPSLFERPGYITWVKEALRSKRTPFYPYQLMRAAIHSLIGKTKGETAQKKEVFAFLAELAVIIQKQKSSEWMMNVMALTSLAAKHNIELSALHIDLIEMSKEGFIRFSNPNFQAYFLAWKGFHEDWDANDMYWEGQPEAGRYFHQMCWDKFIMSEQIETECRIAGETKKFVCREIDYQKIERITRFYIKQNKFVDWRFLRGLNKLKGVYLENLSVKEIPASLINELPSASIWLYLMKEGRVDNVLRLNERFKKTDIDEELTDKSIIFSLDRVNIRQRLHPENNYIQSSQPHSGRTLTDVMNLFEKDLSYFPVDTFQAEIVNENALIPRYKGYLGVRELDLFDMAEWYVLDNGLYNLVLFHNHVSTLLIDNLRNATNKLVDLYGEDDYNLAEFTVDDEAQIEDGHWRGRQWAWGISDSYQNPIHLYLEESGYAKLEIYGLQGNFVDLPTVEKSHISIPE